MNHPLKQCRAALAVSAVLCLTSACSTAASVAVGTVAKTGSLATKTAVGATVGATKLTAKGVTAAATAGAPAVKSKTLADRAGRAMGERPKSLTISDTYQDGGRTDYVATTSSGKAYQCFVVHAEKIVSEAVCQAI